MPTLKELHEKKYQSLNSNLLGMVDDLLEKGVIQLLEPNSSEEIGRTVDPKYCRYHRIVSHPLEQCISLKERIMRLIEVGIIILNLDKVVETNHIAYQTKGLSLIQFRNLEPFVLYENELPNPTTQERSFPVSIFHKLAVNMF